MKKICLLSLLICSGKGYPSFRAQVQQRTFGDWGGMCCLSTKGPVFPTVRGRIPAHLGLGRGPAWDWRPQGLWCIQLACFGSEQALEAFSNTERRVSGRGCWG